MGMCVHVNRWASELNGQVAEWVKKWTKKLVNVWVRIDWFINNGSNVLRMTTYRKQWMLCTNKNMTPSAGEKQ